MLTIKLEERSKEDIESLKDHIKKMIDRLFSEKGYNLTFADDDLCNIQEIIDTYTFKLSCAQYLKGVAVGSAQDDT